MSEYSMNYLILTTCKRYEQSEYIRGSTTEPEECDDHNMNFVFL